MSEITGRPIYSSAPVEHRSDVTISLLGNKNGLDVNIASTGATIKIIENDSGDADIIYIGEAPPGSADSDAVWKIARWDTSPSTGETARKTYADSNTLFDNVWTQAVREALNYG